MKQTISAQTLESLLTTIIRLTLNKVHKHTAVASNEKERKHRFAKHWATALAKQHFLLFLATAFSYHVH